MKRVEIKALFAEPARYTAEPVTVCGWVRTLRSSKALGFIELNDGSYFSNLQVVFEEINWPITMRSPARMSARRSSSPVACC